MMNLKQAHLKIFLAVIAAAFTIGGAQLAFSQGEGANIQQDISDRIQRFAKPPAAKERILLSSSFEYSECDVLGRYERWTVSRNRIAYLNEGLQFPYIEVSRYSRGKHLDDEVDYTYDFGGFFKHGLLYGEGIIGFGQDSDYEYDFKLSGELSHPLVGNFHVSGRYKLLSYTKEDINIVSPGFIYYFGNNYIFAYYNAGITKKRGTANWGVGKINFNIFEKLNVWVGGAIGQRLYDITGAKKATKQEGYIAYTGVTYDILNNLSVYVNLLYGTEEPKFIQRSLEGGVSFRF